MNINTRDNQIRLIVQHFLPSTTKTFNICKLKKTVSKLKKNSFLNFEFKAKNKTAAFDVCE